MNIGAIGSNCYSSQTDNFQAQTVPEGHSRADFARQLASRLIKGNNKSEIGPNEFLKFLQMTAGKNIQALEERFKKFDLDESGALDETELTSLLQSTPSEIHKPKIEHLQKELNLLNSLANLVHQKGSLSREDLIEQILSSLTNSRGMVSDANIMAEEIATKIFARLDQNGDGSLDTTEIQKAQQEAKDKIVQLQAQKEQTHQLA